MGKEVFETILEQGLSANIDDLFQRVAAAVATIATANKIANSFRLLANPMESIHPHLSSANSLCFIEDFFAAKVFDCKALIFETECEDRSFIVLGYYREEIASTA